MPINVLEKPSLDYSTRNYFDDSNSLNQASVTQKAAEQQIENSKPVNQTNFFTSAEGHGTSDQPPTTHQHTNTKPPSAAKTAELSKKYRFDKSAALNTSIIIVGFLFLTGLFLPCVVDAQAHAKLAVVKGNMRTIQIAAEDYAKVNGKYPKTIAELKSFLPGGSNGHGVICSGVELSNPLGKANTLVVASGVPSINDAKKYSAGQVIYRSINNQTQYAITAIGFDHENVMNGLHPLLLHA